MKGPVGDAFRKFRITILFDTTAHFLIPFFSYLMKLTCQTGFDEHDLSPRFIGFIGFVGFIGLLEFVEL